MIHKKHKRNICSKKTNIETTDLKLLRVVVAGQNVSNRQTTFGGNIDILMVEWYDNSIPKDYKHLISCNTVLLQ